MTLGMIACIPAFAEEDGRPGFPSVQALRLLRRPSLRAELELTPAQIESLIVLEADRQMLHQGRLNRGDEPSLEERRRSFNEFLLQWRILEEKALAILLPAQRDRLDQILLQSVVRADSPRGGVTHPEMVKRLGLVEPQLEAVRQRIIDAEKKYKGRLEELLAEITKAKKAAQLEILGELTPEQRRHYQQMIGEPFDPQPFGEDLIVIER